MKRCQKCHNSLIKWSKYKDMERNDGTGFAIAGSIFNGLKHFVMGNSGYRSDCDHWSLELYFCESCKTYYMKCPNCGNLMSLSEMPRNGKTIAKCSNCGDKTLYAGDYNMGGG